MYVLQITQNIILTVMWLIITYLAVRLSITRVPLLKNNTSEEADTTRNIWVLYHDSRKCKRYSTNNNVMEGSHILHYSHRCCSEIL